LNLRNKLGVDDALAPGFSAGDLEEVLSKVPEAEGVVLVGHEPDFSLTVERLTGGRVVFKKGAIAQVRVAYPSLKKCELVWLVQPAFVGL
jgi:phosphohistidine phosphatase SixA